VSSPLISLVVPVFNEEANLRPFHEAVAEAIRSIADCRWEFVFVDDGSSDGSFAVIEDLRAQDARVNAVRFARNFGSHIAIPFGGVLCGCKSELGAMNDALRLELRPFGIHVCLIEPGASDTPAADKTLGDVERIVQALPPDARDHYAVMLREFTRRAYEHERAGSPPDVVARAVHHALTAGKPHIRYPVGKDARVLVTMPRLLPDRWLDQIRLRLFGIPTEGR